jgi:RHS repeat-associated protein
MKLKYIVPMLMIVMGLTARGQDFNITVTGSESGTITHYARNSITFGLNYTYTPSGGTMTAEIQNPVVTGDVSYGSIIDPETRSLNTSYMVGTTQGTFNVSPVGGATYTIPIDVPPGVAGMQPGLAITYNSMGGPGVVGYGWNISGLSAITRTGKTYYHDGSAGGINLDANDRFSLDGQRLVCVEGDYGGNESKYRTENDVFTRVTCTADGDGPSQFFAETKAGLNCQYGYDGDGEQTIDGYSQVLTWYMNKAADVYGNQINYGYLKNNGSVYPGEITYGPNAVTFYYKIRDDKTTRYLKGSKIEQNLLLDKIEVKYNSTVVKKYEFKYNYPTSNYTRYSVLNEVIEYGIGSSRLNSTVFTYQTPDVVSFTQTEYNVTHNYITYKSKLYQGDFNGDGKTDFLCLPDESKGATWTGYKIYFGDGDDNFTFGFENTGYNFEPLDDIRILDLNGDGKDDVLYEKVTSGTSYFIYIPCTGSSFENPVQLCDQTNGSEVGFSGKKRRKINKQENDNEISGTDYDGDGINDVFINSTNGNWKIYSFGDADGQLNSSIILRSSGTISTLSGQVLSDDFNGDGKADIWSFDDNGVKIYTYTGLALSQIYSDTIPTKNHLFSLGDFNGDGKTDMFIYGYTTSDWSQWQVRLSNGTGFETRYISQKKSNLKNDYIRMGDFNGDGCTDLMVMATNDAWSGHYYYISKNQGADFYSHFYSGAQSSTHNYFVADFNGDGRDDYLCTDGVSPWWSGYMIYKSGTKNKPLMEKVGNGFNQLLSINFKTLSQYGAPYTKGTGANFPVFDFQGALPVVSSVSFDNGRGSQNTTDYTYEGAKIHRQGKGFLCYSNQIVTDAVSNLSTETSSEYHTVYYYVALTTTVNKYLSTTLSTSAQSWTRSFQGSGVMRPSSSALTQTDNLTGHSVTQTASYDTYGNPTQIVKSFNNGVTETTTNGYDNNTTNWWLGRLTSSSVSYAKSGETTISNTVNYTYASDGILKPDFIKYYEGTDLYYYKNHDYDSHGNLSQLYEYGTGVGDRTTTYTYETSNHVRLKTVTDPLGHTTTKNYDTYGRLSSEVDYLDNTTSYTYDNLGRIATLTQSDGLVTTTTYNWGLSGGPTYACYNVQRSGNDGSLTKTWYDELAREIRTDVTGFDGSPVYTVTEYNTKGQVYRVSEPSASVSPSQWNTNTWDSYGRIDYINRPSGRDTDYSYSSNRVTETTGGKTSYKDIDSQGLVTLAHDNGGDIVYAYFPDGKVKTITAPGGVVTTMEYNDAARNQTKLIDPSAGTTEYTYDSFGQLKTRKNARNQTTTYNYYTDGRLNTKVTPEGTTTYTYNDNKQLTGISSPGSISRSYGYDSKGRVNNISETIPGSSAFSTTFTYDTYGRLSTRTHPSGIVETNNYNSYGYLSSVSAGGTTRYTITGMNPRQQITAATFGSSLSASYGYDSYGYPSSVSTGSIQDYRYSFTASTGNLYSRENYLKSTTETFTYDNLDRLTGVTGPQNLTIDYAANGNITTKSDVGSVQFGYNNSSKPYALTDIEAVNGLISDSLQTVSYTSFEQPSSITENPYQAAFLYNSDNQRAKMTVTQGGNTILTRWYTSSRYMKETAGSTTKEFTYLGGDAYTAPVVAVTQSGTDTYYYLLRDYLGTVTHLVNTSNSVVGEYSFDAWGRRRVADDWDDYNVSSEPDLFAGRGFTGHEYLPWFGLYNMNGRLYDPVVGRFLSPDNYVQMPDFTQSYNRYSYVLNNPLKYIDPSGQWRSGGIAEWYESGAWMYSGTWMYEYMYTDGASGFGISGFGISGYGRSGYGGPGYGDNGPGLGGVYYDWYSGAYRSTGSGNPEVDWRYAYRVASSYSKPASALIYSGTSSNPYETFRGVHYTDGSTWYAGEGYTYAKNGGGLDAMDIASMGATGFGLATIARYRFEWEYLRQARINRALSGNLSQPIKHSLRTIRGIGTGTTIVGGFIGAVNFALSDQSWGDYGQLGVSLLSTGLTLSAPTAPIGIGLGAIDAFGGLNSFYNYLDVQQNLYNNTGGIIVPINGISQFIRLK